MKKLFIFSLLLVLLCVPVLSSCSKKPACYDCYNDYYSHVTLSFGMKDGETKTYDLSKETVKIYLDFHVVGKMYYTDFTRF